MGNPFSEGKASVPSDAGCLGIYLIFLFGTIPVMPYLWEWITRLGKWHRLIPEGIGIFLILLMLRALIRQKSSHILLACFFFSLLTVVFVFSMDRVRRPVEKIHFSEYSLLSFLLFRFLRHWKSKRSAYAWTLLGVCLIGFLDESVQGLVPNRVYDPRDLWFNGVAGVFGLVAVILLYDPFFVR